MSTPSNPQFPNQQGASPFSQAYVTQLNAGQMIREVCNWNPSVDPMTALRFLNEKYRVLIDCRSWYGLKIRGQISVPTPYSTGTCTVTNNSDIVTGIGTGWTKSFIGQQFRINFTYPYQTIIDVDPVAQTLTLDFPFAGNTQTAGYMILAVYFPMDGNIKRMLWAVNQLMGWRMKVNVPVEAINLWDTWRTFLGWSTHFVTRPPTPSGQYQIEIWPSPFQQQVFPYEAYTQPPDMQADTDTPVAFIRSDVIVAGAIGDALMFRPKQNTYFDMQSAMAVAREKKAEYWQYVEQMSQADNDLDQRDVSWDYGYGSENTDPGGVGSYFAQSHDI